MKHINLSSQIEILIFHATYVCLYNKSRTSHVILSLFCEIEWNLTELTTIGVTMAICCQLFCYMCMFIRFLVLWVVELIYRCGGEKECFVWSIKWLFPSLPPLLSTVYQCDGYLSSRERGGFMTGLSGFASH